MVAKKSTVVLKGRDASNILWAPARTQCVRNNQNSKEASKEYQHQNLTVPFLFLPAFIGGEVFWATLRPILLFPKLFNSFLRSDPTAVLLCNTKLTSKAL